MKETTGERFAQLLGRWRAGGRLSPAIVMGIVNVTPDSFSDGGAFLGRDDAISEGRRHAAMGAAMLDIGGESTRAQATPVPADEEMRRVLPVIKGLSDPGIVLSIDTMKPRVAEAALRAGAGVVNDVRGLQGDPELADVAASRAAGVIIMHNPGLLGSAAPLQGDPVSAVLSFFDRSLEIASKAGIGEDRIALDPGFGFGKSVEQNCALLARIPELSALGFPLLVGTSRKSFIGELTGRDVGERLIGSVATNVAAALAGAAILRVHDVAEHVDAVAICAAIRGAAEGEAIL